MGEPIATFLRSVQDIVAVAGENPFVPFTRYVKETGVGAAGGAGDGGTDVAGAVAGCVRAFVSV